MTPNHTSKGTPRPGRPLPVDDHGRHLSTQPEAAVHYRAAQRAASAVDRARRSLRRAVEADGGFVIASAALAALERIGDRPRGRPSTSWERRHLDIVIAAQSRRPERSVDLLREHLLDVGCDPLACLVVRTLANPGEVDDLVADGPGCHPWPQARQS